MLLTIDIGNTVVTLGLFEGDQLYTTVRLATDTRRQADEYGVMLINLLELKGIEPGQITSACLCSKRSRYSPRLSWSRLSAIMANALGKSFVWMK